MDICFVYDAVAPWEAGGVQTRVWELGRRLSARGHDVHWYGLRYWDGPAVIERDGITFHGVMAPPSRGLYVGGRRSIPEAVQFAARLVRPLLRRRFDVIDCQAFPYFPVFSSKLNAVTRGGTLALTWHEVWDDYWYEYLGRMKGAAGRAIERAAAALPDVHIAVSELTRRDVARFGADAELLPNGVDMDVIADAPPAETSVDVVFVGRLIEQKGPHLLIKAIDRLRGQGEPLRCQVIGEGPEYPRLKRLIGDRGLDATVRLRGPLETREEVLSVLKTAAVYALPSAREGFGITALEALACGTPVVTTAHGRNATTALIDDGRTGAVCPRTVAGIADGIRAARRCRRGACRRAAAAYDWTRIVDRAERLYRAVA